VRDVQPPGKINPVDAERAGVLLRLGDRREAAPWGKPFPAAGAGPRRRRLRVRQSRLSRARGADRIRGPACASSSGISRRMLSASFFRDACAEVVGGAESGVVLASGSVRAETSAAVRSLRSGPASCSRPNPLECAGRGSDGKLRLANDCSAEAASSTPRSTAPLFLSTCRVAHQRLLPAVLRDHASSAGPLVTFPDVSSRFARFIEEILPLFQSL